MSTIIRWLSACLGVLCALGCLQGISYRSLRTGRLVLDPQLGPVRRSGVCEYRLEGSALSHWLERGVRDNGNPRLSVPQTRVLLLGDSQLEAFQVADQQVCVSRAERALRATGWRVELINAGRAERSLADYVSRAQAYQEVFHPDWVVVMVRDADLLGDAWDPKHRHFRWNSPGLSLAGRDPDEPAPATGPAPAATVSRSAWDWREWWVGLPYRWGFSHLWNLSLWRWSRFESRWAAQPPLFWGSEPVRLPRPEPWLPIEQELDWLWQSYHGRLSLLYVPDFDPLHGAVWTQTYRRISRHCRGRGYPLINAGLEYSWLLQQGRPPCGFFNSRYNFGHLNQHGHAAVGRALEQGLQERRRRGVL